MKKIIVLDAEENAFLFDGHHMENLGHAEKFKNSWKNVIYAIGKNLYGKFKDKYFLLAIDAEVFGFGAPDTYAEKQFACIGGEYVYLDPKVPGIHKLPNSPVYAEFYATTDIDLAATACLIKKAKGECYVFLLNADGEIAPSEKEALLYNGCLFWNGGGYILHKGLFLREPWTIAYQNEAYLVLQLRHVLFFFGTDGTKKVLGRLKEIVDTPNGKVLLAYIGKDIFCYHFGDQNIQNIVCVTEGQNYSIDKEGNICHEYIYQMSLDDPDTYVSEIYKFRDGKYVRVTDA